VTGRRRLPVAGPNSRRRFVLIEVRVWVDGTERRSTLGRWVTRTTGRPKSHSRGRTNRDAEVGA